MEPCLGLLFKGKVIKCDLRFVCVCNSKVLLLLKVEMRGHQVQ